MRWFLLRTRATPFLILLTLLVFLDDVVTAWGTSKSFRSYLSSTRSVANTRSIFSLPTQMFASNDGVKGEEINGGQGKTTTLPTDNSRRLYGAVKMKDLDKFFDLIVIGGGPAGIAGAVKAAQLGRRTIIVDKPCAATPPNGLDLTFGGPTGLFSKAFRDAARKTNVAAMRAQGLDDDVIWKQIENTITKLASRNFEGQLDLLKKLKIYYLQGEVSFLSSDDPRTIEKDQKFDCEDCPSVRSVVVKKAPILVGKEGDIWENQEIIISSEKVLICTGSKATELSGIPYDNHRVFQSDSIVNLSFFPRSVVINGAGIIAIEFANIFNTLGTDVTMLIRGDLKSSAKKLGMDFDVADELIRLLIKSGVKIKEQVTVDEFLSVPSADHCKDDEKIVMKLSDGTEIESDIFLAALGRTGNGLDPATHFGSAGVESNKQGHIQLADKGTLSTVSEGISAAGDVIGPPSLASTSMAQAQVAVQHMFQPDVERNTDFLDKLAIGIWTIPEVGYFGMTKEQAERSGLNIIEGVARFDQCLRGRVFSPEGLLKLVVDSNSGEIVGTHIIGTEAAEMVHYGMSLVESKSTIFNVLETTFTAVTFHELFKEAALDANSKLDFGIEWQQILSELSYNFHICSQPADSDEECGVYEDIALGEVPNLKQLKCIFNDVDKDGNGQLDEKELRSLFNSTGRKVYRRTISNLMRLADVDGSGTLDWEEFTAIWEQIPIPNDDKNNGECDI